MDRRIRGLRAAELAMARGVTRWITLALAGCAAVAIAYLPPRGTPNSRFRDSFRVAVQSSRIPQPTAARLRAQGLAEEWRGAHTAVRLREERRRMETLLAGMPNDSGAPVLLITGWDSVPPSVQHVLAAALDSAWRQLGLGATKVRIGVVLELIGGVGVRAGTPRVEMGETAYLLPDSTDRATCVAMIPMGPYWTRILRGQQAVTPATARFRPEQVIKGGLGPCAFYAAFGAPGKPVRHWLARRQFDLARYPGWDAPLSDEQYWPLSQGPSPWYWAWLYHQSFPAVACMAGRPAGCSTAVLAGADGAMRDSLPRLVAESRGWWRSQRLIGGDAYLADLARAVGHERFQRFWNSSLDVDTALALAMKAPVGEWTVRWQLQSLQPVSLGPAAPGSAVLLGVALAAVVMAAVARSAMRRQVR
jgi:hypothetical protein